MKNIMKKGYSWTILLFVILYFFTIPSLTFAQNPTHIVKKGDTLWDICQQYYGDPNLWPKLWEMNPFITNPHLLQEGDVITLFEKEKESVKAVEPAPAPAPKEAPVAVVQEPVKEVKKEPIVMGIDISAFTEINAIGSLSFDNEKTWGYVFATEGKSLLSKGETAYVLFNEDKNIKIGDEFFIGNTSPLIKHPISGKDLGYIFNVKGKLVIKEQLGRGKQHNKFYDKKNVFSADISESYGPISINDTLMPYKSVSSCVLPVPNKQKANGNIIATKNQERLIHPNSIVYIDLGSNDEVKRGNVLNIVKTNITHDPDQNVFSIWDKNLILPDIFLGRLLIIECGPDISTALVLSASEPFSPGVYLNQLSWEETPDFIASIAACPIK
jgi:hypothetical protein